jgi:hypothetical protein
MVGPLCRLVSKMHVTRCSGGRRLHTSRLGCEGIEDLLRSDGVRVIVVSDRVRPDFEVQRTLRDMLQSKQFKLLGTFPIFSTWQPDSGNLPLYENQQWAPPTDKLLTIRMLTLNHDRVVPFDQFDVVDNREARLRDASQDYQNRPPQTK